MTDYARLIASHLDASRSMGVGTDASLTILKPNPDGGYDPVFEVEDGGWTLEDLGLGKPQLLYVVAHGALTSEVLAEARLFRIKGAVYNIAGGYQAAAPVAGAVAEEWVFPVAPTGEPE
jgi:hypothetical protein